MFQRYAYGICFATFALLALAMVFVLKTQRSPWPLFITMQRDAPEKLIEFTADKPAIVSFNSPASHLCGAHFEVFFPDKKNPIRLTATNRRTGTRLAETLVGFGTEADIYFEGGIAQGDEIEILFEVTVPKPWTPKLKRIKSDFKPMEDHQLSVKVNGQTTEGFPAMLLLYNSGWKGALWLWVAIPLLIPLVLKFPNALWPWLILIGFCCLLTSWHGWNQRYGNHYGHTDPDRYGVTGQFMADWVRDSHDRPEIAQELRSYQHTHVASVSVMIAALILIGFPMHEAYLFINILASFATLLLFHFILHRQLKISSALSIAGVLALACHFIFLRSFARPTTDQMGILCVTTMLTLLIQRMRYQNWRQTTAILLVAVLLAFVRPPGLAYAAFLIGMTLFADLLRERKLSKEFLRTAALIATVPVLVIGGIYWGFDLFHNFALAREKNKDFASQATWDSFKIAMIVAVQLFFVGWFFLKPDRDQRWPIFVLGIWFVLHTLLLIVVQAPFITRLMTPVLPSVIALACLGLNRFEDSRIITTITVGAITAISAANLWVIIWAMNLPAEPKSKLTPWFYAANPSANPSANHVTQFKNSHWQPIRISYSSLT